MPITFGKNITSFESELNCMHRTKHQIVSNVRKTTINCTYILSSQSQLRIEW